MTVPMFYDAILYWDMGYGYCGLSPEYLYDSCCYYSKNLAETGGYKSGGLGLVTGSPLDVAPIGSSNYQYCHLHSDDSNNYFGLLDVFVLNNGKCNFGVSCSNSILTVFNDTDCISQVTQTSLSSTVSFINELNVTGQMITNLNGTTEIYWTAVLDENYTPTTFDIPSVLLCITIALMGVVYLYSAYLDYRIQTKQFWKDVLIHHAWTLSAIVVLYNLFVPTCSDWIPISQYALSNICSLITVLNGVYFWNRVLGTGKLVQAATYMFILLLHMVLAGANYFIACYLAIALDNPLCPYHVLSDWFNFAFYWILYMFIQNTVPIIYFAWKILSKSKTIMDTLTKLNRDHKTVTIVIVLQVVGIVVYILANLSMQYSNILGGDEQAAVAIAIKQLMLMLHGLFNTMLTNELIFILKGRFTSTKMDPAEKPKMLLDSRQSELAKGEISTMMDAHTRQM
ncbi:hypothetical protein HDV01_005547 [Terramyces sp. JEL0728]|nr:hypothetical protein HDV01_005547 [Terramyces sp. JEL0728]